jgi:hypothetical protein
MVYFNHDPSTHTNHTILLDFQDGRWVEYAEEPYLRAKEYLKEHSCNALVATHMPSMQSYTRAQLLGGEPR